MTNNMRLWDEAEKTDPKHTKDFTRTGGFKGTAINATYVMKRLTELFGPCGQGWRMVIEDDRMEAGHAIDEDNRSIIHVVRGHLEYNVNGEWYATGPQYGQTTFVGSNKYGPFTDEEAPKKSITDCMTKCAVMVGVCADVHLGLFDDNKYVNDRKREEQTVRKTAAAAKKDGDYERIKAEIEACDTMKKLQGCWKTNWPQIQILPKNFEVEITELKDTKKAELEGKDKGPSKERIDAAGLKDEVIAQLSDCFNLDAITEVEDMYAQQMGDMAVEFPDLHEVVQGKIEERKGELNV